MTKRSELEKFCGNCHYHSMYTYPDVIFCFQRFQQGKNAIFATLDCCEQWKLQFQECFCLEDALKEQNREK